MLAMQALESGTPFPRHLSGHPGGPMAPYGGGALTMNGEGNGSGKVGMLLLLTFRQVCAGH